MANNILPDLTARDYSLLIVLFMAEFSRNALFLTFLPLYTTEILGWTTLYTGVSTSVHFLTENIFKSLAGSLYDKFGGSVLKGGLIIGLVSLALAGIYSHPALILIASGLLGLGFSPLWAGIISEVAPIGKKNRPSRISLVFTAWLSGVGSGLTLISFIISKSYTLGFAVICGALAAAFAALWFFRPALAHRAGINISPQRAFWGTVGQFAANKNITRLLMPGMFLQTLSAGILLPILPVFATKSMNLSHDSYGKLLLAGGVVTILALAPMGRIVNSIKLKVILFSSLTFTSAALTGLALAGNEKTVLIWVFMLGISYSAVLPAWNTLLSKAIPVECQATGWGIFSTIEGLGISFGPAIGGFLGQSLNPGAALLIPAGIFMTMGLFYLLYPIDSFPNGDLIK
ncbi:MAG: MFS transporter [Desulfocucumaceae bacterium]